MRAWLFCKPGQTQMGMQVNMEILRWKKTNSTQSNTNTNIGRQDEVEIFKDLAVCGPRAVMDQPGEVWYCCWLYIVMAALFPGQLGQQCDKNIASPFVAEKD